MSSVTIRPETKDRQKIVSHFMQMQRDILTELFESDNKAVPVKEEWKRAPEPGIADGGGGISFTIRDSPIYEQAGVNFSSVNGLMSPALTEKLIGKSDSVPYFATGVSLVFHPKNPNIPTTHANARFLEIGELSWCGGGADLTPYTLNEHDGTHFHSELKNWCDQHDLSYYPKFKKWCDEYFFLSHRKETRGIGGVFFDYLGKNEPEKLESYWEFAKGLGKAFCNSYFPLVTRNKDKPFLKEDREFQLIRRGRYVEFNLLYDRGTKFGLETGGRVQSILMSLPPVAGWNESTLQNYSKDQVKLMSLFRHPKEWA